MACVTSSFSIHILPDAPYSITCFVYENPMQHRYHVTHIIVRPQSWSFALTPSKLPCVSISMSNGKWKIQVSSLYDHPLKWPHTAHSVRSTYRLSFPPLPTRPLSVVVIVIAPPLKFHCRPADSVLRFGLCCGAYDTTPTQTHTHTELTCVFYYAPVVLFPFSLPLRFLPSAPTTVSWARKAVA